MRRYIKTACIAIVLVAGALIYLYPDFRTWRMQSRVTRLESVLDNSNATEEQSEDAVTADVKETEKVEDGERSTSHTSTTFPYPDLYEAFVEYNDSLLVEEQNITDAWEYEQPPFDLSAYGYHESAIGVLKIPDMDLTMPLYLGANYEHMADGAAVLSRTSMPIGGENTNCVIAGHRGWGGSPYFANIENLTEGSYVFIKNPWEEMAYEVTEIRIMHKSETDAVLIREGKDMVTLVTCHPYGHVGTPTRYVVFCERTEMPEEPKKTKKTAKTKTTEAVSETEESGVPVRVESESQTRIAMEQMFRKAIPLTTMILALLVILIRKKKEKSAQKKATNELKE